MRTAASEDREEDREEDGVWLSAVVVVAAEKGEERSRSLLSPLPHWLEVSDYRTTERRREREE